MSSVSALVPKGRDPSVVQRSVPRNHRHRTISVPTTAVTVVTRVLTAQLGTLPNVFPPSPQSEI